MSSIPLPTVHLLTHPRRAGSLAHTLASWTRSDWPGEPRMHRDDAVERDGEAWGKTGRVRRMAEAFVGMLRAVLAENGSDGGWVLLLEDDLEFHPRIGSLVAQWEALRDERCVLASLFNPSLRETRDVARLPRAFAADPQTFLGAQALLLRRRVVPLVLEKWDSVPGLTSQRLARLLGGEGPIWVHRPSLVQHVATDSAWGARIQRALDFHPAWEPPGGGDSGQNGDFQSKLQFSEAQRPGR